MDSGGSHQPLRCLDTSEAAQREGLLGEQVRAATGTDRGWCCAGCGQPVTGPGEAIEKAGAHLHRRTNPHGLIFVIGCFRHAEGCTPTGSPTEEWSWFAGYAWQPALCRGCQGQLGWWFSGAGEPFFGLIVERLVRCTPGARA